MLAGKRRLKNVRTVCPLLKIRRFGQPADPLAPVRVHDTSCRARGCRVESYHVVVVYGTILSLSTRVDDRTAERSTRVCPRTTISCSHPFPGPCRRHFRVRPQSTRHADADPDVLWNYIIYTYVTVATIPSDGGTFAVIASPRRPRPGVARASVRSHEHRRVRGRGRRRYSNALADKTASSAVTRILQRRHVRVDDNGYGL